jgi:hypothetical protein
MRILIFTFLFASLTAFAQAEGKTCVICKRMDAIVASNDINAASRLMSDFRFTKDKDLVQQEADAVTRLTLKFAPQDKEAITQELYYSIYQLNPAAMKESVSRVTPVERALLEKILQEIGNVRKHGNG